MEDERISLIKNHITLSSIHPSFKTKGSLDCVFCGGRSKAYINNEYYRCYNPHCNTQGDLIKIYRKLNNLESKSGFYRALEELEQLAGIRNNVSLIDERYTLLEEAVKIYSSILWTKEGAPALEYLHSRGFDDIALEMYNIGYASSKNTLRSYGMKTSTLRTLNLYDNERDCEYYFNRIVFPIRDIHSNVVHMTGRWVGEVDKDIKGKDLWPRYKDTKGILGTKSYLAFENLIPGSEDIFLTEGYPDALTLNQLGLRSIGILGLEGLTKHYHKFYSVKNLYVIADNDKFETGEYKSWSRLLPQLIDLQTILPNLNIRWMVVPEIPGIKDVNDWVVKRSLNKKGLLEEFNDTSKDILEYYISNNAHDLNNHASILRLIKAKGLNPSILLPYIPSDWNPIQYAMNILC